MVVFFLFFFFGAFNNLNNVAEKELFSEYQCLPGPWAVRN